MTKEEKNLINRLKKLSKPVTYKSDGSHGHAVSIGDILEIESKLKNPKKYRDGN